MNHYGQYTNRIFDSYFLNMRPVNNVLSWPGSSLPYTTWSCRLNLSAPELFFLILAHPIYKM